MGFLKYLKNIFILFQRTCLSLYIRVREPYLVNLSLCGLTEPCPWSWTRMRTRSARADPPTCTIKALCLHFHSIDPPQKHHQTPFSMRRHGAAGQLWKPADQRDEAFLQEDTRSLQRAEGGSDAVQERALLQVSNTSTMNVFNAFIERILCISHRTKQTNKQWRVKISCAQIQHWSKHWIHSIYFHLKCPVRLLCSF